MPTVSVLKPDTVLQRASRQSESSEPAENSVGRRLTVPTAHSQNPLQTALHPQQQASRQGS